jgi:mRNA-degrading endonuclease RelE of RelBE toxin-antitoxin system
MPGAERDLDDLPPAMCERVLKRLVLFRDLEGPLPGIPLSGDLRGTCKLRFGRYRLVYDETNGGELMRVWAVGHRSHIYETVRRRVNR